MTQRLALLAKRRNQWATRHGPKIKSPDIRPTLADVKQECEGKPRRERKISRELAYLAPLTLRCGRAAQSRM